MTVQNHLQYLGTAVLTANLGLSSIPVTSPPMLDLEEMNGGLSILAQEEMAVFPPSLAREASSEDSV